MMAGLQLALPASLTSANAAAASQAWLAQAGKQNLVLDASGLQQFDSAALAALLQTKRQLQAQGYELTVTNPSGSLKELAALYGVDALLWSSALA